jgi:signal transduction histidine kinase
VPPLNGGSPRTIQARTGPIRSNERRLRGAIALLRDVSEEREIDRIKNEFISTAAHELRTPLSSVLGYAELLLNQGTFGSFSFEEEREFLEEIYKKAESLTELVNDLLDLSRIESGQLVRLNFSPTLPGPLIEEVVEDFRRRNPERRFELTLPATLPEIPADASKIGQVMENLLGNAIKFSPPGCRIRVDGELHPDRFVVVVTDEGYGMSPEVLSRIFDKFYRGTTDHSVAGLGLGMPLVKNIVEAHGGEVQVESTRGIGTRVTFTLPLSREESARSGEIPYGENI